MPPFTKRVSGAFALVYLGSVASLAGAADGFFEEFSEEIQPVLDIYCYDCHGYGSEKGGVVLDEFDNAMELRDHGLWLRALKNLRSGLMPPADELQPSEAEREEVLAWIKAKVFQLNPANPDPGRQVLRRLNRVEYRNTIRDLLGYDYDTSAEFPADDTGHGFDNMGDVLTISPMLLEKYLDAAQQIVAATVPTRSRVVAETVVPGRHFVATGAAAPSSGAWTRDLSYYKPVSVTAERRVEVGGTYEIVWDLMAIETYVDNVFDQNRCTLVLKVDGEVVLEREFTREGWQAYTFVQERHWEPGLHRFTAEVVPLTPDVEQVRDLRFRLNKVSLRGPFSESHFVEPKDYRKFFPRPVPEDEKGRREYARELIEKAATRAFRRPVEDYTLERLVSLAMYSASGEDSTFEAGIAQAYAAILASPRFLFREESVLGESLQGDAALVDEWALASRLSYFLWSTMPDETLFDLARQGLLRSQLRQQVQRMLADPKASALVENFVGQWLQARDIESVPISEFAVWLRENPNPELERARATYERIRDIRVADRTDEDNAELERARAAYRAAYRIPKPSLGGELRRAMLEESESVFEYILQEDRSVLELLKSDYTFLNEELAAHYGIEGVEGEAMRRFQLPDDSVRGGVLTQGTVLAVTSNPTRTSPVKRGVFILDNILGTPPPPPPPNIPSLEDAASPDELKELSLRETLALHAEKSTCRSCHNRMDPLGLALENFNALGRWRESEMDMPIEPEGRLITGEGFSDIRELKEILVTERRDDFYYCFTEKLLTYALGRGLDYYDVETVDRLVAELRESGGKPSVLIHGIIESAPFQKRRVSTLEEAHTHIER
ncbi:DUF1592 domain-containing protein [Pelagicoccus sp. SDUM812005]|uniref:DUF1592 domain-containing protein n=1 Tax=Pelagicoccus sp. SDUM812005 TaxID=3041257 RepID=UPI00280EED65|nr:DUF1592 domain-containing protein [Pelagicoccus sp. SDUM812005]MDQ8179107.1 DUF1592 domain-containing protein [Pelagicoccus sp. SDUM812005]